MQCNEAHWDFDENRRVYGTRKPWTQLNHEGFIVAPVPNRLWVTNFAYFETHSGFGFAVDVFSRYVVGWQVSTSLKSDLTFDALGMVGSGHYESL